MAADPMMIAGLAKEFKGNLTNNLVKGKGVYDFFKARQDEKKANEELAKLKTPFYKIQDEYTQNRNIAGNIATSGLPDATKDYFTTESQRGLGTSINAITQNGGNPNDAGRLMDIYNSSINRVAAQDAQARIANIQNFMNVNRELAGQKTIQWSLNEYAPFQRKLKELTQRKAAALTNQNTGINTVLGAMSSSDTANQNSDLMRNLFAKKDTTEASNAAGMGAISGINQGMAAGNAAGSGAMQAFGGNRAASGVMQGVGGNVMANAGANYQAPINVTDPNNNPYGNEGYWDGTQWIR